MKNFQLFISAMKDFQLTITVVVTIIGWGIVHFLTIRREKSREWREFSRELIKLIEQIEKDALTYHKNNVRDKELEEKLKRDISFLEYKLSILKGHFKKFNNRISAFRQAITLENFETSRFEPQNKYSLIITKIAKASRDLQTSLYDILS